MENDLQEAHLHTFKFLDLLKHLASYVSTLLLYLISNLGSRCRTSIKPPVRDSRHVLEALESFHRHLEVTCPKVLLPMSAILGFLTLAKYKYSLTETGIPLSLSVFLVFMELVKLDLKYCEAAVRFTKNPIITPQELSTTIGLSSTLQLSNTRLDVSLAYHSGPWYPTLLNYPIQASCVCMRRCQVALDPAVATGEDPHTTGDDSATSKPV